MCSCSHVLGLCSSGANPSNDKVQITIESIQLLEWMATKDVHHETIIQARSREGPEDGIGEWVS